MFLLNKRGEMFVGFSVKLIISVILAAGVLFFSYAITNGALSDGLARQLAIEQAENIDDAHFHEPDPDAPSPTVQQINGTHTVPMMIGDVALEGTYPAVYAVGEKAEDEKEYFEIRSLPVAPQSGDSQASDRLTMYANNKVIIERKVGEVKLRDMSEWRVLQCKETDVWLVCPIESLSAELRPAVPMGQAVCSLWCNRYRTLSEAEANDGEYGACLTKTAFWFHLPASALGYVHHDSAETVLMYFKDFAQSSDWVFYYRLASPQTEVYSDIVSLNRCEKGEVAYKGLTYTDESLSIPPVTNDVTVYGDYTYTYKSGYWTAAVTDKTKTNYGELCGIINGKEVRSLYETFRGCANLLYAPKIPSSVTLMGHTFRDCPSLVSGPDIIPRKVSNMYACFYQDSSLTGQIYFQASPTGSVGSCFLSTVQPIVITCPNGDLSAIAATARAGNVLVQ